MKSWLAALAGLPSAGAAAASLALAGDVFPVALDLDEPAQSAVAMAAAGDFTAVWTGPDGADSLQRDLFVRHFGADGEPTADAVTATQFEANSQEGPAAVALRQGGYAIAWYQDLRSEFPYSATVPQTLQVSARLLDTAGQPAGDEFLLSEPGGFGSHPELAPLPQGFVAAWHRFTPPGVELRRFDDSGQAIDETRRADTRGGYVSSSRVAAADDGSFVVVWDNQAGPNDVAIDVWGRRFDATGQPLGIEFPLNSKRAGHQYGAQVAAAADGRFAAVWLSTAVGGGDADVLARVFAADGTPLAPEFPVHSRLAGRQWGERVVMEPGGRFAVAWVSAEEGTQAAAVYARRFAADGTPLGPEVRVSEVEPSGLAIGGLAGDGAGSYVAAWSAPQDGRFGVFGRRLVASCDGGAEELCLGGRFRVEVSFQAPGRSVGAGAAVPLTADTGAFWFFDIANPELVVKVLDGRAVNGHFWVFLGALTDVAYELRVTDTATGERWTHANPQGTLTAHADTRAFAEPPGAATSTSPLGGRPAPDHPLPVPPCAFGATQLCLGLGERFEVSVAWRDPRTGLSGQGEAVALTADAGAFWFFAAANLELLVKVVDGRAVNGRHWLFWTALTDLELEITVRDDQDPAHVGRTYRKPAGELRSLADTQAF